MVAYITSGVYATSFSTRSRDGKTYYRVDGWQLGRKVYRRSASDFHGSSTNPLQTIGWCDYISEEAYKRLSVVMKDAFDKSSHGVAPYSALVQIPEGGGYFKLGLTSDMVYDPLADPCADVSCPDKCVGVDKFDQVCKDGICVRGTLIETNSVHCGYTPEPTPDPTPDPTPTPDSDTYIIIALMLAGTYMILRR